MANLAITNADGTGAKSAVGTECYTAPTAPATVATADYISIDSKLVSLFVPLRDEMPIHIFQKKGNSFPKKMIHEDLEDANMRIF